MLQRLGIHIIINLPTTSLLLGEEEKASCCLRRAIAILMRRRAIRYPNKSLNDKMLRQQQQQRQVRHPHWQRNNLPFLPCINLLPVAPTMRVTMRLMHNNNKMRRRNSDITILPSMVGHLMSIRIPCKIRFVVPLPICPKPT